MKVYLVISRRGIPDNSMYVEGVFASLEVLKISHNYHWIFTDEWKHLAIKSRSKGSTIAQCMEGNTDYYLSELTVQGIDSPVHDFAMAALGGDPSAIDAIIDAIEKGGRK